MSAFRFSVSLGFLYGGKNVTDNVEFYGRNYERQADSI